MRPTPVVPLLVPRAAAVAGLAALAAMATSGCSGKPGAECDTGETCTDGSYTGTPTGSDPSTFTGTPTGTAPGVPPLHTGDSGDTANPYGSGSGTYSGTYPGTSPPTYSETGGTGR